MRLGIITDEVSQELTEVFDFAKEFDLGCVELRSAWEKGPFEYTREDICRVKEISDSYGIPVTAISSPVFKCAYSEENVKDHTAKFAILAEYATILGATTIRCFDFLKDDAVTHDMIKDAYSGIIDICEKNNLTVVIEMEPTANSYDCATIAATVAYIDNPRVRSLYDPGNVPFAGSEIPYPDGYESIKATLAHVHVKDTVIKDGKAECVMVGTGSIGFDGVFASLAADGYDGDVMLETHYRKNSIIDEATLHNPKGSAISENAYDASYESMVELKKIVNKYFK